ncbi:hypothetical protein C1H46_024465 [Malus baccata]|uniref:Uncharacterized protein n=1 Tax=Malus baccata TaxID=106549 RepID=A0A540LTZ1_MALBA|nr:hypothetical protein C1H46_024465 [Malus baccata]
MPPPAVDVVRGMVHRGVDGLQIERGLTTELPVTQAVSSIIPLQLPKTWKSKRLPF